MKNEAFYSVQQTLKSATEQRNLAIECTDSGPKKTANGKARKARKIGHRGQQFGAPFFTPSNFNFKSISTFLHLDFKLMMISL